MDLPITHPMSESSSVAALVSAFVEWGGTHSSGTGSGWKGVIHQYILVEAPLSGNGFKFENWGIWQNYLD